MIPATKKLNLILLAMTLFCWVGLGFFYGIGYCPVTDWHWRVKESLGEIHLPNSYIKYEIDKIFQMNSNPLHVDILTGVAFGLAFLISIYVNFFKGKKNEGFDI